VEVSIFFGNGFNVKYEKRELVKMKRRELGSSLVLALPDLAIPHPNRPYPSPPYPTEPYRTMPHHNPGFYTGRMKRELVKLPCPYLTKAYLAPPNPT